MRVFSVREQISFMKTRTELDNLMQLFDEKVVTTLEKQEYELLKAFEITMERMTNDLKEM